MKWHDVEQHLEDGSVNPVWMGFRAGKITISKLSCVMANYGKAFGPPAKNYAAEIALGQLNGTIPDSGYSNAHMERGNTEEQPAREEYESMYFTAVTNGGFFDCGDVGCSPDGLVGDDGMIEIKSAITHVHVARVESQSFDTTYKWQLAGNLMFSGREWIDFISYCSSFPEGRRIYVYRCFRDDFAKEFEMIDTRLNEFRELIALKRDVIENNSYSLIDRQEKAA